MTRPQMMLAARRLRTEQHLTYRKIGVELGVSPGTARDWCCPRKRVRPRSQQRIRTDTPRVQRVHEMWHAGVPAVVMAEREGLALRSLYQLVGEMRRAGLEMPDRRKHRVPS